ncbi:MAG: hypothetical protein LBH20_02000 [Treponema sp.]|jgi:hypothetical protein|nr:hypothetical protein [Treponema sp.]
MKREEGAVELGAVIILFFVSAIFAGSVLFIQANMTYFRRNSFEQEEKIKAENMLKEIVRSFQPLKGYDYDAVNNPLLLDLQNKYADYNLAIMDISSGYHLDFLTDSDLHDTRLREFLFRNGNPSEFIAWRNSHGLSTVKTAWRSFLRDEAWDSCVSYGWIHTSQTDSFAFSVVSASYKTGDLKSLFPLVNQMPLINVNMVSPDIITPLIMRPVFEVKKPSEKAETLKNKLLQGQVILSDLSSYLEIPKNHALFTYLGTKTAFWRIIFCYRSGMYVEAVVAAIPKKDGGIQEIAQYILIDRNIRYEL